MNRLSPHRRIYRAATWFSLLVTASFSHAQSAKPVSTPLVPPTTEVKLVASPKAPTAKAARYRGQVDTLGMAFVVPANTVFGRSGLLIAGEPGKQLLVQVKNELSLKWDRELMTDANGRAELKFRTEGRAYILVRAVKGNAPYVATFFVHDELPIHKRFEKPFVSKDEFAQRVAAGTAVAHTPAPRLKPTTNALDTPITHQPSPKPPQTSPTPATPPTPTPPSDATGTPVVLWLIAGLLAVLVVFVGIFLLKGKKSS